MNQSITIKQNNRAYLYITTVLFIILFFISVFYLYTRFNKQIVHLHTVSGPIVNPLMGWAPWATIEESTQPHALVYMDLTWKEFEPQEGVYDFAGFEEKQQMERWLQEGKRVVFRFVMDIPGDDEHMDIPAWLYDKINGDGKFYRNSYGRGFSPNYSNSILIEHHGLAIKTLGDKYGKNDFFAYIQMGSLGHWGEWHQQSELGQLPVREIRDIYVYDYIKAFPNTHLLMRRPFTIARDLNLGLYNDMTGNFQATTEWLNWIQNGDEYLAEEENVVVPMPSAWEKAPIGGEQSPILSYEHVYLDNLETTLQLIKESHTTFIGPFGPYRAEYNGHLQDGINQVLSVLGYRLYIDRVETLKIVQFEKTIGVKLDFSNQGIAPFYYNWEVVLYLFDENGNKLQTYQLPLDLRDILPNQTKRVYFNLPVENLDNGKYKIGVAILDSITGQPSVKLANENSRNDLIQEVAAFEVKWLFNSLFRTGAD